MKENRQGWGRYRQYKVMNWTAKDVTMVIWENTNGMWKPEDSTILIDLESCFMAMWENVLIWEDYIIKYLRLTAEYKCKQITLNWLLR